MKKPTKPSPQILDIETKCRNSNEKHEKAEFLKLLRDAQKELERSLEHEIIKTIAAFMNSQGGYLLVGVENDKTVSGIEKDFEVIGDRQDKDGWLQHFKNLVCQYIDRNIMSYLSVEFISYKGKTVAEVEVQKSFKPKWVSLRDKCV